MNVFNTLSKYLTAWKLVFDSNGKPSLYNASRKEYQEIILHSSASFRERTNRNKEDNEDSYDNIQIYSVNLGDYTENGKTKSLIRYGFIDESGYAITRPTYDKVEAFKNGKAIVYLKDQWCVIDKLGRPLLQGNPVEKVDFIFRPDSLGYTLCCNEGKYGLLNRFRYLCIPCEYNSVMIDYYTRFDGSIATDFVRLVKNGIKYLAILKDDSVINIIDFCPKSKHVIKNFILIEEELKNGKETISKYGLLDRGGIRILKSEFDSLDIVSSHMVIVSKDAKKQLFNISIHNGKIALTVRISNCNDLKYGEGYSNDGTTKYSYASVNDQRIEFLDYEDKDGLHTTEYRSLTPEDDFEFDHAYFDFDGNPNNYIALVSGNKTKLINLEGEEIMPLVIPSDCHVLTNTYNEGIVGISKKVIETNLQGNQYEETRYSYINSEGKVLTDFKYDGVKKFENGQADAHYNLPYSTIIHTIDINGNVIHKFEDGPGPEPQENNWAEWRDDAFEGDPEAYWNID